MMMYVVEHRTCAKIATLRVRLATVLDVLCLRANNLWSRSKRWGWSWSLLAAIVDVCAIATPNPQRLTSARCTAEDWTLVTKQAASRRLTHTHTQNEHTHTHNHTRAQKKRSHYKTWCALSERRIMCKHRAARRASRRSFATKRVCLCVVETFVFFGHLLLLRCHFWLPTILWLMNVV